MAGIDLGLSGIVSGFDWRSFIDQMVEIQRQPEQTLQIEKVTLQSKNTALSNLKSQLSSLKTKVDVLKDPTLFSSRKVGVSNSTIAQASVSSGTPVGTYSISVSQYATASTVYGSSDIGAKISATGDVSGVVIGSAPFFP